MSPPDRRPPCTTTRPPPPAHSKLTLNYRVREASKSAARLTKGQEAAQLLTIRRASILWALMLSNALYLGIFTVLTAGMTGMASPVLQYACSSLPAAIVTAFLTKPTAA